VPGEETDVEMEVAEEETGVEVESQSDTESVSVSMSVSELKPQSESELEAEVTLLVPSSSPHEQGIGDCRRATRYSNEICLSIMTTNKSSICNQA